MPSADLGVQPVWRSGCRIPKRDRWKKPCETGRHEHLRDSRPARHSALPGHRDPDRPRRDQVRHPLRSRSGAAGQPGPAPVEPGLARARLLPARPTQGRGPHQGRGDARHRPVGRRGAGKGLRLHRPPAGTPQPAQGPERPRQPQELDRPRGRLRPPADRSGRQLRRRGRGL
ncbi:hypothetical protein D3C80_1495680 [compost metagenome]